MRIYSFGINLIFVTVIILGGMVRMSMCGTKVAAQNWQKKVQETLATLGFSIGKASPILFCHPQRSLKCLVHGDDFVVSGEPVDLVWMRNEETNQECRRR